MDKKRIFDVVASATGLALLSPVFAVTAAIGYAHFRKNPFFVDQRVGKGGELYKMFKFRSMRDYTDTNGTLLPNHLRKTKWGSFIKMTAIDEFPQLVNVLKGDMSIVGPRPRAQGEMGTRVPEAYRQAISSVKPGITGPWQVAAIGRDKEISLVERFALDASYATNTPTFMKDMRLISRTLPTFLWGHDGRGLLIPGSFDKN